MDSHEIREYLRSLDEGERKVVKSVVAGWNQAERKIHAGGRPKVMRQCDNCNGIFSARDLVRACPLHGSPAITDAKGGR